jgi:IMP and pyridine-specific 5'-nucleotidase
VDLFKTHETAEAIKKAETWLAEALAQSVTKRRYAKIYRQVPGLGYFFHPLPLTKALAEYDEFCALTKRRYVMPNFAEVGRCRLTVSKPELKARLVPALETKM